MFVTQIFLLILLLPAEPGDDLPENWIGAEACMECHDDMVGYETMPHFKAIAHKANMLERSCETCHGAGFDHEEDATLENILTVAQKEQISNNCRECHKDHGRDAFPSTEDHKAAGVSCLECHGSGHKHALSEPMLNKEQPELCISCHREQMVAFSMPYTHRDGNKPMACTSCHATHQPGQQDLLAAPGSSACAECHREKSGPFVFSHAPREAEECASCHSPHGSPNPFMLTRAQSSQLCLECHADTPLFHDMSQSRFNACTSCHSAVHGSNTNPHLLEE